MNNVDKQNRSIARQELMARMEARFRDRLDQLLTSIVQKNPALTSPSGYTTRLAHLFALQVEQSVESNVEIEAHRNAIMDRADLIDYWPLSHVVDEAYSDFLKAVLDEAKINAPKEPPSLQLNSSNMRPEFAQKVRAEANRPGDPIALLTSVLCAMHVESVYASVRQDAARKMVPLPATKESRSAMLSFSSGPGPKNGELGRWRKRSTRELQPAIPRYEYMMFWDGRVEPYQLGLSFGNEFDTALVRGIIQELQDDGLRDYLILHRMAAEQGRKGAVRWTWKEHMERSPYAARIQKGRATDERLAAEVTRRIFRLKGAELFAVRQEPTSKGIRRYRIRVGPFGLIDVPADVELSGSLELAIVQLNPEIYGPASAGAEDPYFALLPDEALTLDGNALRLATMIALDFRVARDSGGEIARKARGLWMHMLVEAGRETDGIPRYRWPRAEEKLHRILDRLAKDGVIGSWEREPGDPNPDRLYMLRPPQAWRDQVIHGVTPMLPPTRAVKPRTVGELRAWRAAKGLSQEAAALRLGVGIATLKRTERRPDGDPIGPALSKGFDREPAEK